MARKELETATRSNLLQKRKCVITTFDVPSKYYIILRRRAKEGNYFISSHDIHYKPLETMNAISEMF